MFGYNTLTKSLFSNFPMFLLLSKFVHVYSLPHPLSLNSSQSTTHPQHTIQYLHLVQFNSVAQSRPTLCDPMNRSTPGLPVHHQLLEFTQTHVHRVGDAIQPSHPLSSPSPPAPQSLPALESFPMSQLFTGGGFSFSIIPSKEHPRLISFRMDWLDLLAVQGTLKSLLQHHSSKASILQHSAFFTVQLSLTSIHDHWENHSLD